MKAKKLVKSLGMAAVALTLVSACMVGSTLAKYTTTIAGTGSAVVAKWAPEFKNGDTVLADNFTVKLTDTSIGSNKLTADKIAPGTDGSFAITISHGAGSDVGFHYTVTMSDVTGMPTNLKFYSDADFKTEISGNELVSGDLELGGAAAEKTVYWRWATGEAGDDAADTTDGTAATTASFKLNCTATQLAPEAPAA